MKKIINRLTYDTATATSCAVFYNGLSGSDFGYLRETIRCAIYGIRICQNKKSRHKDLFLYYTMKLIYHSHEVKTLEKEMLEYKYYDSIDALWCCLYNINKYLYDL